MVASERPGGEISSMGKVARDYRLKPYRTLSGTIKVVRGCISHCKALFQFVRSSCPAVEPECRRLVTYQGIAV